jgi:hypothetical protein
MKCGADVYISTNGTTATGAKSKGNQSTVLAYDPLPKKGVQSFTLKVMY